MLSARIIVPALVCALLLLCATQTVDSVATYCEPEKTSQQPVVKMVKTLDVRVLDEYGRCVRCSSLKRKNPRLLKKHIEQGVCLNMADEKDFQKICGLQITENRDKTENGTTSVALELVELELARYKKATIGLGVFCGILLILTIGFLVLWLRQRAGQVPTGVQESPISTDQNVPLYPTAPPEDDDIRMANGSAAV